MCAFGRSSTVGMPSRRAVRSVSSAPSGHVWTMSICPPGLRQRARDEPVVERERTHAAERPYGIRSLPRASVGRTRTPAGSGRCTAPGITSTSAPASAAPAAWCQAVVQILAAPILCGKLWRTLIGSRPGS